MEEESAAGSLAERFLETALLGVRGSGNSEVKIELKDPEKARNRSDRAWMAAGLATLMAVFSAWVANDARADLRSLRIEQANELRAQRIEQAIMNRWIAQEVTAIRSYITTGKLAPMTVPPVGSDQQEHQK